MLRRWLEWLGCWRRFDYVSKEWLHEQQQREPEEYYSGATRWPVLELSDALKAIGRQRNRHARTVR